MSETTRVLLITGFLGSGKTTLLNRLVQAAPQGRRLTVLMNEFGEIGVDGRMIRREGLDLWEVNRGSIFCACVKSDFIKGLAQITNQTRPEALIIEATGVADPSGLRRDLALPLWQGRFELAEQVCLLDAANFMDAYEVFASLEKQISTSSLFILNKTDLAGPDQIAQVKEVVARHHAEPRFIETSFAAAPVEPLMDGLFASGTQADAPADPAASGTTPEQVQALIRHLESVTTLDLLPPDPLRSQVYCFGGSNLEQLEQALDGLPDSVPRIKGFVMAQDQAHLVSYVMGDLSITPLERDGVPPDMQNLLVVISRPGAEAALNGCGELLRPCP